MALLVHRLCAFLQNCRIDFNSTRSLSREVWRRETRNARDWFCFVCRRPFRSFDDRRSRRIFAKIHLSSRTKTPTEPPLATATPNYFECSLACPKIDCKVRQGNFVQFMLGFYHLCITVRDSIHIDISNVLDELDQYHQRVKASTTVRAPSD